MSKTKSLLVPGIVALSFSMTACATFERENAYTGEKEVNAATIGTLTGAVLGAGAGIGMAVITAGTTTPAIWWWTGGGAATGAVLGGGLGYYMDKQEAELRARLLATGVQVARDGNNITLIMPKLLFPNDNASVNAKYYPVLDSVALVMKEYDETIAVVAGYTDHNGSVDFNQKLSETRANAVASYLHTRDLPSYRFYTVGHSEALAVADNNNAAGRAENRRATITLIPTQDPNK